MLKAEKFAAQIAKLATLEGKSRTGLLSVMTGTVKQTLAEPELTTEDIDVLNLALTAPIKADLLSEIAARLKPLEKVKTKKVPTPKGEQKRGKPLDPNSGRQKILRIIADSPVPISTKQIAEKLKEQGEDIKYPHSHIAYFKEKGQIVHVVGTKTYKIHPAMAKRLDELDKAAEAELTTV